MCIVCCISMQCTKFSSKWEHKDIKSAIKPKLVNRKTTLVSGEKFLFEERRIVTGGQPSGDHTLSCSGPSGGTRHKRQEVGWDLVLGMVSLSLSWVMIWVLPSVGCLKPRVTCHVSPCHRMRPLSHKIFVCVSCFPAVGHMQPGPSPSQAVCAAQWGFVQCAASSEPLLQLSVVITLHISHHRTTRLTDGHRKQRVLFNFHWPFKLYPPAAPCRAGPVTTDLSLSSHFNCGFSLHSSPGGPAAAAARGPWRLISGVQWSVHLKVPIMNRRPILAQKLR